MTPTLAAFIAAPPPAVPATFTDTERAAFLLLHEAPTLSAPELAAFLGMSVFDARCAIALHRSQHA